MFRNILANFLGRFWSIVSNFLFIPLYIKFLGFESYSIVSFTLVIAGIMAIFDSGLTATLSRGFARNDHDHEYKVRTFVTLESIYLIIVSIIIIVVVLLAPTIAKDWLHTSGNDNMAKFIMIISFDFGFQMLLRFYMGGLLGFEKQVEANLLQMFWGIIRNGVVVLIILFNPSLYIFFLWQSLSTIIFTLLFRFSVAKALYGGYFKTFNFKIEKPVIKDVWKFAGGMLLISLVAAVNTQLDKLTISKLLPIEQLGYYTLAVSLATSVAVLVNPIATAILPRFTALFSSGSRSEALSLFKITNLYTSVIISCVVGMMAVFAKEIIWIWTGDHTIAEKSADVLIYMVIAYSMLAFSVLPYNIAIANGYTKINNYLGIASIFIAIPGYWMVTERWGVYGVAVVFAAVQIISTIVYLYFINKKFLHIKPFAVFCIKDLLLPLILAGCITFVSHYFLARYFFGSRIFSFLLLSVIGLFSLLVNFLIFIPQNEKINLKKIVFNHKLFKK